MDIVLVIVAALLLFIGIMGCIIPAIPGPIISFVGMIIFHMTDFVEYSTTMLVLVGIAVVVIQIIDQVVPVYGTKKFGGTKYGTWGSIIGLICGLFFLPAIGPFGIITILGGPFLGAYIGEKINGQDNEQALRSAVGSFLGFMAGTLIKLAVAIFITIQVVSDFIQAVF
jgi:uncharacterized protein YqgC (DUF456 family)